MFFAFGLLPGTWLVRVLRLPSVFWTPMVFATASALCYLGFWLAFFSHAYADTFAAVLLLVNVAGFLGLLFLTDAARTLRQRDAWLPLVLMLGLSGAYLANLGWAGVTSTYRFTVSMPPEDNVIPLLLADQMFYAPAHGRRPPPVTTVGLIVAGSDRPPLQAGVVATTRALGLLPRAGYVDHRTYQVLSTLCQMVWLPALYALARTIGVSRRQLILAMIAAACSGALLLNALYTWPKLYAAWLFLLALALVIHAARQRPADRSWALWSAIGGAGALALLAHGSAIFSVLALPVLLALPGVRRALRPSAIAAAALTALLFLAPWTAYQTFYDPPGNRLTKMHLAGANEVDDRSTLEAMAQAYRTLTRQQFVHARWTNLRTQWIEPDPRAGLSLAARVQEQQFGHQLPALGPLLIGLVLGLIVRPVIARRRTRAAASAPVSSPPFAPESRQPAAQAAERAVHPASSVDTHTRMTPEDLLRMLACYALASVLCWALLLFNPGAAILQHASLATTLLLILCGAAWLDALPRAWRVTVIALHVLLFIVCWLPMETLAGGMPPTWNLSIGIVMAAFFAAFFVGLRAIPDALPDIVD